MNMLYDNDKGKELLNSIIETVEENGMHSMLMHGVILGLSGGADSVILLYTLIELKKLYGDFAIKCVHVNHMIRGSDADADEDFCKKLSESLNVPISVHRVDVPKIAKEKGEGIEEAARNIRYQIFADELLTMPDNACIAVAHNATDNLETIIFNMMRGAGINGLSGIKPVRDNIIRPLINVPKAKIIDMLDSCGIDYVTDKTNFDSDYSRNYIRNEILPLFKRLNPDPEAAASRVSKNLRDDIDYIESIADRFCNEQVIFGEVHVKKLLELPKSLFSRVLVKIIGQKTNSMPERTHIDKIYNLLSSKDFEYSLPGNVRFVSRLGVAKIVDNTDTDENFSFCQKLSRGVNKITGFNNVIILSHTPIDENYSNVYKIEICATLPSDIIKDGLYVRNKEDGDSYSYGGITHKLKKLFSDRKIPCDKRKFIPVISDSYGIVWVAGFGVRNEESEIKRTYVAIAKDIKTNENSKSFFITQRK